MRHARGCYIVGMDADTSSFPPSFFLKRTGRSAIKKRQRLYLFRPDGTAEPLDDGRAIQQAIAEAGNVTYTHIFYPRPPEQHPDKTATDSLAAALKARPYRSGSSAIPAGYTYLGQFIFHDISAMSSTNPGEAAEDAPSPALDLDSVLRGTRPSESPELATEDGLFKIGETADYPLPEDLPRQPYDSVDAGRPLIADARNDDFLPLAQCHLLLLKFYNAVARHLGHDGSPRDDAWWRSVRTMWVQHFQSVVLDDFLVRLVDDATYNDVKQNGRKLVRVQAGAWLPLEFAVAVGRFGHSLIRDGYNNWNKYQNWRPTTIEHFMRFSYANSGNRLAPDHRVLDVWATDWFKLFDFSETDRAGPTPMFAATIDTHLAPQLHALPVCLRDDMCTGVVAEQPKFDLAAQTMDRGRDVWLSGAQQAIALANQLPGFAIPTLSTDQLFPESEGLAGLVDDYPALAEATPLWYYVLREAELLAGGLSLGPLGGRILMETIHAAISASEDSILDTDWEPQLRSADVTKFTMPDLILSCAKPDPFV